jgi:hypothetical protein
MGGSWVLFFISDNQEIQHGSPGVLGLIFYNGQPRIPTWESILYWVIFFITDNQELGSPGVLGFIC